MIKFYTGKIIGTIGAYFWKHGGWTGDETYGDLQISGKIGYHMITKGLVLMGIIPDDLRKILK